MDVYLTHISNYLWTQSWQIAVLAVVIGGLSFLLKNKSAHVRYLLWLILLVKCFVPPLLTIPVAVLPQETVPQPVMDATAPIPATFVETIKTPIDEMAASTSVSLEEPIAADTISTFTLSQWLGVIWVSGMVLFVFIAVIKAIRLHHWLKRTRKPLSAEQLCNIRNLFAERNPVKLPPVWLVDDIGQPFVWGLFRGSIYLPGNFVEIESEEHRRGILSHELSHVHRFDAAVNLFQILAQVVFWFHPLVWWANKKIRSEREKCCDEMAIAWLGTKARDFSTAIVNTLTAEHNSVHRIPSLAVAGPAKNIEDRIKTIMDPRKKFYKRPGTLAIITIMLLAFITIPTTLALASKSAEQPNTDTEAVSESTDTNNSEPLDPNTIELGEAIHKRLTTYSDIETIILHNGETSVMNVKENVTEVAAILITPHIVSDGTQFDLEGVDKNGETISGTKINSSVIHDADSHRMALGGLRVDGKPFICKIQLTPERQENNDIVVEVKVLFAESPTPEEINAMLLTRGKEGQMMLDFQKIARWIIEYRQRNGHYPENLEQLNKTLPEDVYSPTSEDYLYESGRRRYILSSCGKDGIYGNDDDEVYLATVGKGVSSGQRGSIYPLEEEKEEAPQAAAQSERVHGERPKGNCSISGKVVCAQTGRPLDHATVYLFYLGTHAPIFINVAGDGSFVFKDIPTGPFSLRSTNTAGYQDAIYDPEGKTGQYPQFSLAEGEQRSGVILAVEPAYSISGRVFDENGTVLKDSQLTVLAWIELDDAEGNGNRYNIAKKTRITADGSYLLDGLDGRPVYIMVIDWNAKNKDDFYPPCYYPGTVARNDARKVSFDGAACVNNIDIHLTKKGESVLEGIITDSVTGEPIPKTLVTIHHRDMLFDRLTTYTDEQGYYRVETIGAGDFLVHVDAEPWGYVRNRMPAVIETTKVTRLDFALRPAATISGKIVDEDGNPIETGERAYGLAYRQGYSTPETMSWSGVNNKYGKKGNDHGNTFNGGQGDYEEEYMDFPTSSTFVIEGMLPGKTLLRFHPKKEGQEVLEILYNGQNIMETGIETKAGDEIKDVTIVIGLP